MKSKRHAFTLIELLIVVAIIAILAAIAVPNFLEAQTRSKISRVKSDMRTLATGIEAYAVDNNVYPVSDWSSYRFGTGTVGARLYCCTTPISYITSMPRDPFVLKTVAVWWDTYEYWDDRCAQEYRPGNVWSIEGRASFGYAWRLLSLGPDYTGDNWRYVPGADDLTYIYDATNGTISPGDIVRLGGPALYDRHTKYTTQ